MRIKVMVLGLASVLASWQAHADGNAAVGPGATADGSVAVEQVVISGDKLKRTEIDSSASVGTQWPPDQCIGQYTTLEPGSPGVEAVTRPIDARQNLSNEPRNADKLTRSAALEQTFKAGGAGITAYHLDSVTGRYLVNLGNARQIGFGVQGHI